MSSCGSLGKNQSPTDNGVVKSSSGTFLPSVSAKDDDSEEMTSKLSSSNNDEKNMDNPSALHGAARGNGIHEGTRKMTKVAAPDTPEDKKKMDTPKSKHKASSVIRAPTTMERFLDDTYADWAKRPPTTFGSQDQPCKPIVRRVSLANEGDSESEDEEKANLMSRTMARMMSSTSNSGGSGSRKSSHDRRRRVVEKDGDPNIQYKNISKRRRKYFSDLFTTLVDLGWIESLLMFAASFYITWLFFAVVYYIICYTHGDLEENHLPGNQENSSWKPCVLEIEDFASCFLFSLETQHTIGYGSRQTTNECTSAMIAMSLQSILGCLIQAFMVGIVFAKLSRPQSRSKTVVFSKQAVVCERNRKLCMIFRIGDMRHNSFIVNASLSVKIIRRRISDEGEMYHEATPIKIKPDSAEEPCVFLIWPITVIHTIDEESPFYKMTAAEMAREKFELHVVLEGVTESTSTTFQARTSYLPREILWGHRFEPMMLYRRDHNKYQVNFSAFNSTYEVDTPICSSYELEHYYKSTMNAHKFSVHQFMPKPSSFQFNANPSATSSGTESGDDSAVGMNKAGIP